MSGNKCVIVINENLSVGMIANTAAVISLTLGKKFPKLVGYDLKDNKNDKHHGITTTPVPVLKATGLDLHEMREAVKEYETELTVVDLISANQITKSYNDYAQQLKNTPVERLEYLGVALYGTKMFVNKFTGSLGLLC